MSSRSRRHDRTAGGRVRGPAALLVLAGSLCIARPAAAASAPSPSGASYYFNSVNCATNSFEATASLEGARDFDGFSVTTDDGAISAYVATDQSGHPATIGPSKIWASASVQSPDATTFSIVDHAHSGSTVVATVIDPLYPFWPPCYEQGFATTAFTAMAPVRALDTRPASAVGWSGGKPAGEAAVTLALAGRFGIAADAVGVVLNVTATESDAPGWVAAVPAGEAVNSSVLNLERPGQTIANSTVLRLGDGGSVTLVAQQPTHLIVDVVGWFAPTDGPVSAGRYLPAGSERVVDTRVDGTGMLPAGGRLVVHLAGRAGVVAGHVVAAVVNVTATEASGPGFVQVAARGAVVPGATSTVNVERAGETIANQTIVPVDQNGDLEFYVQPSTHLVVDLLGTFTSSIEPTRFEGLFVPLAPERVLDTRAIRPTGYSAVLKFTSGPGRGTDLTKPAAGAVVPVRFDGLPAEAGAVVLNLTATESGGPGFVQAGALAGLRPGRTSALNLERRDETMANLAVVALDDAGGVGLYTQSGTSLVADLGGFFLSSLADVVAG